MYQEKSGRISTYVSEINGECAPAGSDSTLRRRHSASSRDDRAGAAGTLTLGRARSLSDSETSAGQYRAGADDGRADLSSTPVYAHLSENRICSGLFPCMPRSALVGVVFHVDVRLAL